MAAQKHICPGVTALGTAQVAGLGYARYIPCPLPRRGEERQCARMEERRVRPPSVGEMAIRTLLARETKDPFGLVTPPRHRPLGARAASVDTSGICNESDNSYKGGHPPPTHSPVIGKLKWTSANTIFHRSMSLSTIGGQNILSVV